MTNQKITVKVIIDRAVEKVWELWNSPDHIVNWNHASNDWHTVRAENELRVGGRFFYRMEAKDKSFGFDFQAVYDRVEENRELTYTMIDDRCCKTIFDIMGESTKITTTFDAENENPIELQKAGWQAILNNFKKYAESI